MTDNLVFRDFTDHDQIRLFYIVKIRLALEPTGESRFTSQH